MAVHRIDRVEEGSYAWELGIEPGMYLVSVNGKDVEDVFDYRFAMTRPEVTLLIREENGDETELTIEPDEEDFGISFESGLMDDYRSCCNKCIFCFIDQLPKGMRKTLYFKDDDSRLSFLQGNYVTLTNMSDHDIDRIIEYRMEPINISVQTTNPELRVKMLRNRFAGSVFEKMKRLKEAHIAMNGQIVLCKGWNDGEELDRTIRDLTAYLPEMQSVSVVPVGLSRYREGLTELKPFTPEDASRVIDQIETWQKRIWEQLSLSYVPDAHETEPDLMRGAPRHFIHASDEWYILAGRELPEEARYDGFLQYENGVGIVRLQQIETDRAIEELSEDVRNGSAVIKPRTVILVSGLLAEKELGKVASNIERAFPEIRVFVAAIRNDFFGEQITVTGLITGGDLIRQMKEQFQKGLPKGDELLIPSVMLKRDEELFLDDMTVDDVRSALDISVRIVSDDGKDLVFSACGLPYEDYREKAGYEL